MNHKCKVLLGLMMFLCILIIPQLQNIEKIYANGNRVEDLKKRSKVESQEELAKELIRFHVIANSDREEDQRVKREIKDLVIKKVSTYLKKSQSIEETRNILQDKKKDIIDIAVEELKKNNMDYGAKAHLGEYSFPTKYYGNFSLPAGEYEAFRIVLGEGIGENWWCVMFPPLCFIHVEEVEETEEVEEIEKAEEAVQVKDIPEKLDEEKEKKKEQEDQEDQEESTEIIVRWKIVEVFKSLFKN